MKLCDGMIIQRDSPYPVWTDNEISILFLDKKYDSAPSGGKWLITLDAVPAGGPYSMQITDKNKNGNKPYKIEDIYAGDLWICAGQSNMEMQMDRLRDDYPEEWQLKESREQGTGSSLKEFPIIRQFKVNQEWDFVKPKDDINGGEWLRASKETLHEFTAAGWFFAKNLYEKYKKAEGKAVPIGLVNAAWGGTPIESWMSRDALSEHPAIIKDGEQYADAAFREEITQKTAYAILEWENNLKNEDVGFALNWQSHWNDISDWGEINLPGNFFKQASKPNPELDNFCGVIWLAKDFIIDDDFAKEDAKVWLGTITDADTVYINGKEIGNTGYRYPPRKYSAKAALKEGKNRIVIRVTCNNGEGEVTPGNPFRIFTENRTIELSGGWKYKIGAAANKERPQEFFFHYKPMGNYNAMIAPLLKYPFKGAVWYQGESNEGRADEYETLFKKMILDWRAKNQNSALPFLFVQLPIWREETDNNEKSGWALMRESQARALELPFTGMACALELGEWNDLHPLNKKDVGYRLFLAAEKLLFGTENTSPGPMPQRWELRDNKLFIFFDNYGAGLISKEILTQSAQSNAKEEEIEKNFAFSASFALKNIFVSIINNEGQINLPATIEGKDCISVDLSGVKNPKKVLYAWADNPKHRNLYNSIGLPAIPFRIKL